MWLLPIGRCNELAPLIKVFLAEKYWLVDGAEQKDAIKMLLKSGGPLKQNVNLQSLYNDRNGCLKLKVVFSKTP